MKGDVIKFRLIESSMQEAHISTTDGRYTNTLFDVWNSDFIKYFVDLEKERNKKLEEIGI